MADVPDEDEDTMSERAQAADEDRHKDEARWSTHFVSDNHALRGGWALGVLMAAGLDAEAVVDEHGNYTDVIRVPFKTSQWGEQILRLRVLPEEGDGDDRQPG